MQLQSLSLDLQNKMSTSLAQNKTMVKLTIKEHTLRDYLSQVRSQVQLQSYVNLEDGKLFIRHLLLGLSGNNTLTDLTLDLHSSWWDWPEGEYNVLHFFYIILKYFVHRIIITVRHVCHSCSMLL